MITVVKQRIILLILIIPLVLQWSCSDNHRPQIVSMHTVPPNYATFERTYWWSCKFKLVWPEDVAADFAIDLLLAHSVIAPILAEHINNIPYWRFHRRATRNKAGHQFSFLFYSDSETAFTIFSAINQSKVLKRAISSNLVEEVKMDDSDNPQSPHLEDTSDHHWSSALQYNWPAFIMGVSALWLGLIDDAMIDSPENFDDIHELLEQYRHADEKVTDIWQNEGQHALLHHLNAVFGYKRLRINKEMSF